MARRKSDSKTDVIPSTTVIGPGIKMESAKLTGTETVVINGTFLGDIDLDGFLMVGAGGSVIGNVRAKQIEVSGKVKGVVVCDATIHLTSTAYVEGGIATQVLKTDEGARINGQCRMTNDQTDNIALELTEKEGKLNFDFSKLGDTMIPEKGLPVVSAEG